MFAVHAPSKSILVNAVDPLALCEAMPTQTKLLGPTPQGNIAIRHTLETTRVLRNLGFDVPSPIITQYNWDRGRYPPLPHQKVMADFMVSHKKCFNLTEMGGMKSKSALWAADYLMSIGAVHRCLIVSTLSTLQTVWQQEIFETVTHRSSAIVHGSVAKREKALNKNVDFYITNHDGLALENVYRTVRRRTDIDLIIVDELGFFRNEDTDKWKFLNWILEKKEWFWGMTGTPTPNEPVDAWALCKLVDPTRVPKYKGSFKRETMYEVDRFRWKPRKGYEAIVHRAMQPAIRFLKADVVDLPPVTVIQHQTRLTHEQEVAFRSMRDAMVLEAQCGARITAVNAADKITKLHQALCGCVRDTETGEYRMLPHKPRVDDLCDILKMASAKAIVLVPFKGIIRSLAEELTRRGYSVGVLNGDVPTAQRIKIIGEFKGTPKGQGIDIILAHPAVMAHGLNLTEADLLIFYSPIRGNDAYRQVLERFNRKGQTRRMTVVRMAASPLEWGMYKVLDQRGEMQDNILALYHQVVIRGANEYVTN